MLVSVVIPAFNCERFIRSALHSVLAQSETRIEVIVVNDGSSDRTGGVARASGDARVRVIDQPNRGVAVARSAGLRQAKGDVIAFLDADDAWLPGKLALQLDVLQRLPQCGLVFGDFSIVDEHGNVTCERGIRKEYQVLRQAHARDWAQVFAARLPLAQTPNRKPLDVFHGTALRTLFRGNFVNTCSVVLPRRVAEAVGEFDPSLRTQEDYDYWLRIAARFDLAYVDASLVIRRKRTDQLTRPDQIEQIMQSSLTVLERTAPTVQQRLGSALVRQRLAQKAGELAIVRLRQGNRAGARHAAATALRYRRFDVAGLVLWSLAWLPQRITRSIDRGLKIVAGLRRSTKRNK